MLLQAERAAAAERERLQHEEEERSLAKAQLAKLAKTVRDFEEQSARQSPPPAPAPSGRLGVEAEAAREEAMREMAALEQRAAELEQIENEQNASLARAQADLSRSKLAATAAREMMQQAEALRKQIVQAERAAAKERATAQRKLGILIDPDSESAPGVRLILSSSHRNAAGACCSGWR